MIEKIKKEFQITDDEALYIKEVTEEKMHDEEIQTTIAAHKEDIYYLESAYADQVNYSNRARMMSVDGMMSLLIPNILMQEQFLTLWH